MHRLEFMGGSSVRESVKRLMTGLFTHDAIYGFNWSGKSTATCTQQKRAFNFKALKIADLLPNKMFKIFNVFPSNIRKLTSLYKGKYL